MQAPSGKATPVRFLVSRSSLTFGGEAPAARPVFLGNRFEGFLVRNGLPGAALAEFERRGVPLASPHYLLASLSDDGRESYLVGTILGTLVAVLSLIVAFFQARLIAHGGSTLEVRSSDTDRWARER